MTAKFTVRVETIPYHPIPSVVALIWAALGLVRGALIPRGRDAERKSGGFPGEVSHASGGLDVYLGGVWLPGRRGRDGMDAGLDVLQV